jgi:hypothetical protein
MSKYQKMAAGIRSVGYKTKMSCSIDIPSPQTGVCGAITIPTLEDGALNAGSKKQGY